jgi:DNA (cytosine-5)-methyltransferase 1
MKIERLNNLPFVKKNLTFTLKKNYTQLIIETDNINVNEIKDNLNDILKKDLQTICNEFNINYKKNWVADKLKKNIEMYLDSLNTITYLDLCAGAGGIALGFRNTGKYEPIEFIEVDKKCCKTLIENNFSETIVNCIDINKINFTEAKYKNIDLAVAGSPCQPFSLSGLKKGLKDPRGAVLFAIINMLDVIKCPMFLIENVEGLIHHEKGKTIKLLVNEFKKKGYFVKYKLLNAHEYGVPQKRKRVFIFGSRKNNDFIFPSISDERKNVYDAIYDLENSEKNIITQKYSEQKERYFKKIPQDGCWKDLPINEQKEYLGKSFDSGGGKRGILKRLSYDKPSLTILCSPQQKQTERCHPIHTRPLTILESARIQTFPDDYHFYGSSNSQYKQIGNAVPVKLAEIVANAIASYWFINKNLHDVIPEP